MLKNVSRSSNVAVDVPADNPVGTMERFERGLRQVLSTPKPSTAKPRRARRRAKRKHQEMDHLRRLIAQAEREGDTSKVHAYAEAYQLLLKSK